MKAAFHFLADCYGGAYGLTIDRLFFQELLRADDPTLDTDIRVGDLSVHRVSGKAGSFTTDSGEVVAAVVGDPDRRSEFVHALLGDHLPIWRGIDRGDLLAAAVNANIYVLLLENVSLSTTEKVHDSLRPEAGYLGALEVHSPDPYHWALYDQNLALVFHLAGRTLGIFQHELADADRHPIDDWMQELPFDAIRYEDLGVRETFFDPDYLSGPPDDGLR